MKIRLKYTGEEIEPIGNYFASNGEFLGFLVDDARTPGKMGYYTKEDVAEAPDWDAYRMEAAKEAMLKMLMRDFDTDAYPDPQEVCGMAVLYADELIKQLKEK